MSSAQETYSLTDQEALEAEAGRIHRRSLRLRFLWRRDGDGCFYCRCPLTEEDATFDHFIPRARGGVNALSNLRASCLPCNERKGHSMPLGADRPSEPARLHRERMRPSRLHTTLADVWPS